MSDPVFWKQKGASIHDYY